MGVNHLPIYQVDMQDTGLHVTLNFETFNEKLTC